MSKPTFTLNRTVIALLACSGALTLSACAAPAPTIAVSKTWDALKLLSEAPQQWARQM